MGDYEPANPNASVPFTKTAGATITGGQLVTITADNTVSPSTTGDSPVGVAAHDAATGQRVTVWPVMSAIHELTPQGVVAIAAGNAIVAGTTGFINTATLATAAAAGTFIGICTRGGTGGAAGQAGKAQFIGT